MNVELFVILMIFQCAGWLSLLHVIYQVHENSAKLDRLIKLLMPKEHDHG